MRRSLQTQVFLWEGSNISPWIKLYAITFGIFQKEMALRDSADNGVPIEMNPTEDNIKNNHT